MKTLPFVLFGVFLGGYCFRAERSRQSGPSSCAPPALLDVESGKILTPGEVLVRGEQIAEVGSAVSHPAGARSARPWRFHAAAGID